MNDPTASRIIENYDAYDEDSRLKSPYGILEERHTRELILKSLDRSSPGRILDIGGGTGPYAFWLASLGFEVHLSDLVPRHLEVAQQRNSNGLVASIQREDARKLTYADNWADYILLNGPVYHLTSKSDRESVFQECFRVLKPKGKLLSFAISRTSGLLYALSSGAVFRDHYFDMVKTELATGIRENHDERNQTFLEAYFHTSQELRSELVSVGFLVEEVLGVLGQAWNVQDLEGCLKIQSKASRLMEVARLMESMPDFCPKMVGIGRKMSRDPV